MAPSNHTDLSDHAEKDEREKIERKKKKRDFGPSRLGYGRKILGLPKLGPFVMFPEGNSRNSMASWIRDFMATNLVKLERVTNGEGTRDMALFEINPSLSAESFSAARHDWPLRDHQARECERTIKWRLKGRACRSKASSPLFSLSFDPRLSFDSPALKK